VRAPRGSVKPPTTNESRWTSFSLRHSRERRPGRYGESRVLDDQPLPAARARLGEQRGAVAAHLRRQPDRRVQRGRQRRLEARRRSTSGSAHRSRSPSRSRSNATNAIGSGGARDDLARPVR
jgi:hypothetical protein